MFIKRKEKEKKRKKKNQSIKDWRKEKENREEKIKFFGPDNVWTMCRIVEREKYKRRAIVTWLKPGGCVKRSPVLVTNQIFVSALVPQRTKEKRKQKGERPGQPKPNFQTKSNLIKSYWSMMIAHIIFDLMGNDLQSQSMTYLWFAFKTKHLLVWDFIHLERFSSIRLDPMFSNALLEMKC